MGSCREMVSPRVSVIVANYNHAPYLRRCIDSVLGQSHQDLEIVACDDASTDESLEILYEIAAKDHRVRIIVNDRNLGVSKTRHKAIEHAKGEFITTLDADDFFISPEKLEKEWEVLRKHAPEENIIAFSRFVLVDVDGTPLTEQPDLPIMEGDITEYLITRSCHIPRDFLFRRRLYFEAAGYDEDIEIYEDWDLKIRLGAMCQYYYSGIEGTGYVRHGRGLSRAEERVHKRCLNQVFAKNISLIDPQRRLDCADRFSAVLKQQGRGTAPLVQLNEFSDNEYLGSRLLFLFALPRSGSTMLQRLLGSLREVYTESEPWLLLHPIYARKSEGILAEFDSALAQQGLESFLRGLKGGESLYFGGLRRAYASLYLEKLLQVNKSYFVDKTPRYHGIVEDIDDFFPLAKKVVLLRNPMAILYSMYQDVGRDLNRMSMWKFDLQWGTHNILRAKQLMLGPLVRYEELVDDPTGVLGPVLDELGISADPSVLAGKYKGEGDWQFGDKKLVHKTHEVLATQKDLWVGGLEDPRFWSLARGYLQYLGKDTFEGLGYSFQTNQDIISARRPANPLDYDAFQRHVLEEELIWARPIKKRMMTPDKKTSGAPRPVHIVDRYTGRYQLLRASAAYRLGRKLGRLLGLSGE